MGYMVLTLPDGDGHLGSGLTLSKAFHRVMAFAHCEYIFHRIDGVMHLSLHHIDGVPDEWRDDPELRAHYFPAYQSNLVDDAMARTAIMRNLLHTGFKGAALKDAHCRVKAKSRRNATRVAACARNYFAI